ncbi:MAG: tail fiber protein [Terracidiphilus sp.]|jgi:microcystin-dependent protein
MGSPFIGELRLVGFNFAPVNWAQCQGQIIAISDNSTLFNLIGTTYGGNGQSTFALPNLQSRIPVHMGTGSSGTTYLIGQTGGVESVTLTINQYPSHTHSAMANSNATGSVNSPNNNIPSTGQNIYRNQAPAVNLVNGMLSNAGGSVPHENRQPFLVLNWIISLFGIYPSPS